ncbi:hypothetical protein ACFOPX_06705 [Helicobacter baculiformis]|uniref:Uncharacterized protein n=1 Tax=Helicobacter baculiformis TaxID=427351 RepID=A0ABV7ZJ28_9HELI|nr:hypothetical protein [Helicobacter baculiformis]
MDFMYNRRNKRLKVDYKQLLTNTECLLDLAIRMAHHSTAIEDNSLT